MTPDDVTRLSDPVALRILADGITQLYSKPSPLAESSDVGVSRALAEHDAILRTNMLALAETLHACALRIDGLLLDACLKDAP
jgi:hypothetical protein